MDRKQLIIRIAAGLAIVAVLTATGIGLYRLGYNHGIAAADTQVARAGQADAATNAAGPGSRRGANDWQPGRQSAAPGTNLSDESRRPNAQQLENRAARYPGALGDQQAFNNRQPGLRQANPAQDGSSRLPAPNPVPLARNWVSPLGLVLLSAVIGFSLWIIYRFMTLLATGNGWQLTFSRVEAPAVTIKTKK